MYIPLSVVNIFDEPIELKKSEIIATLEQTSISQTDIHHRLLMQALMNLSLIPYHLHLQCQNS